MNQEIYNRIVPLISDELSCDESIITPEARFEETLGADSLDLATFSLVLEEEFSLSVALEMECDMTVEDLVCQLDRLTHPQSHAQIQTLEKGEF